MLADEIEADLKAIQSPTPILRLPLSEWRVIVAALAVQVPHARDRRQVLVEVCVHRPTLHGRVEELIEPEYRTHGHSVTFGRIRGFAACPPCRGRWYAVAGP